MPAASSYSSGGDVSVLSASRMMPVPSSRRTFSSASNSTTAGSSSSNSGGGATGAANSSSSYTYRTIDRPSYLSSVSATSSSYLSTRPSSRYSSDYKSSLLSDLKPSYSSGTYRSSRYSSGGSMASSSSTATSAYSSSYTRSSALQSNNDTSTSDTRDSGYRSSSSYASRRLDGGTTSNSSSNNDATSTTRSRFARSTLLDTKESPSTTSSSRFDRYNSSNTTSNDSTTTTTSRFLNNTDSRYKYLTNSTSEPSTTITTRPTTLRSRLTATTQDGEVDDLTEQQDASKRPSVAEIRRMFDPVLNVSESPPSRCKEVVTTPKPTVTTVKRDSDDESETSSESEESSEEEEEEVTVASAATAAGDTKSPTRRARASGLPAGSEESGEKKEDGSSLDSSSGGSPTLGIRNSKHGSERGGLVGLRNIGNTCFMNSVLQCLSNTRPLLEYVLAENHLSDINTTTSAMKGALIKAFATLLQELWRGDSDERVVNTSSFKAQVQRFAPRFMGYAQQDAQEFLRYLLEGLHEDVNRVAVRPKPILTEIDDSLSDSQKAMEAWKRYLRRDDSKVVDIFVGQLRSTLRCTVCGHCSVTFDPFWDLSLPIPSNAGHHGQVRLAQCFDLFTKEEVLDGDEKPTCSRCQARQKCTKSFSIHKFPRILVLHLKRFSPMERFRGKLGCTVDFPLNGLDLSAYGSAGRGGSQACSYTLYGVANHSGTTYSGHYIAACKHPYSGAWHEYNDSRVSTLSARSVVSSEAYVLFYELSSASSHL